MLVTQMHSTKGRPVPNQFIINNGAGTVFFQSYRTIIAKVIRGAVTLDAISWNYSRTTSKYRNRFLSDTTAQTKQKIDSGEYKLENLNP